MSLRVLPAILLFAGAVLWLLSLRGLIAPGDWPSLPPWRPETMSLAQIRVVYGVMPRAAMALLVGAALGLAGALMQRVLRNPLADPSVLGVASGAQLALVAAMLMAPGLLSYGRGPVALAGSALAAGAVMALASKRSFEPASVAICGMLVGLLSSGLATALTLARGEYLLSLVIWNGGSLVQQDWSGVCQLALVLLCAALATALLLRPLRLLALGDQTAGTLGLRVGALRAAIMAVAVVLSATVSAEVGLIGFLGLAAPTLARKIPARSDTTRIAYSVVLGAAILWLCDACVLLAQRWLGEMFPTGALTGLIGAPLMFWLLTRLRAQIPPRAAQVPSAAPIHAPWRRVALIGSVAFGGACIVTALGRGPEGWFWLDRDTLLTFLPLRLPGLVATMAAGALLAGAGTILQRLTANPIASPEVLGVSGGAALGYAATVFLVVAPSPFVLAAGAGAGGALVLALLARLSCNRNVAPEQVLLAGLAASAFASGLTSAVMASGDMRAWTILSWLAGASPVTTPGTAIALLSLALALAGVILATRRWLSLLPLGPEIAGALGLPGTSRVLLILAAGTATGAATVAVGPMSFVGLMAPHLARALGLTRPATQGIGAMLAGACLMMIADTGARFATFPYILPIGLFATLLGTPWLLILMLRRPQ